MKSKRNRTERREKMVGGSSLVSKVGRGRTTTTLTPVHVRGLNVDVGDSLTAYVRGRLGFKLGKFAERIERVSVRFEDVSGPKGAPQRACRIKVVLPSSASVLVRETAAFL